MSTNNIVWIVIAALVAIAVIAGLVIAANRAKRRRRIQEAEGIREQARTDAARVERREALAQETAARARAAQAEAEAKAAEAARLQDRAAAHQSEVATSREQLDEQWKRADHLDPTTRRENEEHGEPRDQSVRDEAWANESGNHTAPDVRGRDADHYRGAPT